MVIGGENLLAHPVGLSIKFALLILLAILCTELVLDQMPCFLGVPNCD